MKIRIGIMFGGLSREREISFAGGRTVYDNLDKSLFEPVPVFVDSFGNFCILNWEHIYKGSIRDFYPPVHFIPASESGIPVYAESLGPLTRDHQRELLSMIGEPVSAEQLGERIDFAFLCLHGPFGEDGKIQGLLEYYNIPYSGSGILPSAIGIDKSIQKRLISEAGLNETGYIILHRAEWFSSNATARFYEEARSKVGFPMVVKSATQGSSIGIHILKEDDLRGFINAVNASFFTTLLRKEVWEAKSLEEQIEFIQELTDIRHGLGLPLFIDKDTIYHPDALMKTISAKLSDHEAVWMRSANGESRVVVEKFIKGKEFSCIVIQDGSHPPVALPPTEIVKGEELFDYRSKYLPGLSRKVTPIQIADEKIQAIRHECEKLFVDLGFDVYARIDGFISDEGRIFLNDPNTTSGMMPSSFFFHQAAEIGLNPSRFLTFIIRTSIYRRIRDAKFNGLYEPLLERLDDMLERSLSGSKQKKKVAVILGGYSSERHISVESGRNIYEKLSSTEKYEPLPFFLTGSAGNHELYSIPLNILLKDNADDIREKLLAYRQHEVVSGIIEQCSGITSRFGTAGALKQPVRYTYEQLTKEVSAVFIALHGRPGEDGEVQRELERVGLPYNGSGPDSSSVTIDKYATNELLMKNGMLAARHAIASRSDWKKDPGAFYKKIESGFPYPFIAKPVDDGCSSAVRKIRNASELKAFVELIFRNGKELDASHARTLSLKRNEEFPSKDRFLLEELITAGEADHFLEITGGMLTHREPNGKLRYEIFEPSEALAEGGVLSLEEKFLAGEGQNITPARLSADPEIQARVSAFVRAELLRAAMALNIEGYARIDAFVRVFKNAKAEVIFVEVNSLPGMTPATCIFHQCALSGYRPFEFIDAILEYGFQKLRSGEHKLLAE